METYINKFISGVEMGDNHIFPIINSGEGDVQFSIHTKMCIFWKNLKKWSAQLVNRCVRWPVTVFILH